MNYIFFSIILLLIIILLYINKTKAIYSGNLFPDKDIIKPENINTAKCPQCSKIASTHIEVKELFGLRKVSDVTDAQSWCRECRRDKETSEANKDSNEIELFTNK